MKTKYQTRIIGRQPPSNFLARLAVAVFLFLLAAGLIRELALADFAFKPWFRLIMLFLAGGISAVSILLFAGKNLHIVLIIAVLFFLAVIIAIDPLVNFLIGNNNFVINTMALEQKNPFLQLNSIQVQRIFWGLLTIVVLAAGSTIFIKTIGNKIKHQGKIETETTIAKNIQKSLLPDLPLTTSWCEITGIAIPGTEIAGDYFDVVQLNDHQIAVLVADVPGYGIGAGILSAMTKSALRNQLEHNVMPTNVLENLNRTVYQVAGKNVFITVAYILLNQKEQWVKMATAGHPSILHFSAETNSIQRLRTPSLGLGLSLQAHFTEIEIPLKPGDRFLLYTNGTIEALNKKEQQFDEDRLGEFLLNHQQLTENDFCQAITANVKELCDNNALIDDVTVVSIKVWQGQ